MTFSISVNGVYCGFANLPQSANRFYEVLRGLSWTINSLGLFISRGLSPEEADLQYLKIAASKLVMFGVDAHPARVWDSFYYLLFYE